MSKSGSDSFVHEIALKVTPQIERELSIRLEASRQLYNACIGECLKKTALIRQSHGWQKAKNLAKSKQHTRERKELFQQVKKGHSYSEYSLHAFLARLRKACWIADHIDSSTSQKIASKAFKPADEYLCGKRGRPRYKGYQRLRSIEGKSNKAGIRWKEGSLIWKIKNGKTLKLAAFFDLKDKYGIEEHALNSHTKYCRLIRKSIRNKQKWYLQLILKGKALQKKKHAVSEDVVGIDIGPSTIAAVSTKEAFLKPFCQEIVRDEKEIRKLQKKISRSLRLNNPQNYEKDKSLKKGPKQWNRTQRYKRLQQRVAESKRKLAATRRHLQGKMVNQML